jgi:hypothetical protein
LGQRNLHNSSLNRAGRGQPAGCATLHPGS